MSMGTGDRFRFEMLQSRFQSLVELWDRGSVRGKKDGRPLRPAVAEGRAEGGEAGRRQSRQRHRLYRSRREMDKLHSLYDSLMDARRQHGEDVAPFHKFAALVKNQVSKLRDQEDAGGRISRRGGQGWEGRLLRPMANEGNEGSERFGKSRRSDGGGTGDRNALRHSGLVREFSWASLRCQPAGPWGHR